jgi:polyhydroxybutyrate depolymerase
MTFPLKTLVFSVLGMALVACQAPSSSEAQSLRERIQDRVAERRADRQLGGGDVAGGETITLTVNGQSRNFIVAAPPSGRASSAVIVFHGGGGTAERTFTNNSMSDLAPAMGALAVFPNAIDKNWTDGRITTSGGPDDLAFMRAMIAELSSRYGVDPGRVFGTGISNGAMFTHKLACDAPGLIRAIAPVAGNISEALLAQCNPSNGTPVMIFNGTEDPLMPYEGGRPELDSMLRATGNSAGQDQMVSTVGTADFWAARNGCGAPSETALPDTANDGTTVTRFTYACSGNQVILYRIEGGGHTWPGSTGNAPRFAGPISQEIDANEIMLDFFRGYGL